MTVNASTILSMVLYADDTNIFIYGRDLSEICATLNKELHILSRWFKLSKLSLNVKKTNFMVLKPKGKVICTYPDIYIDETKINKVDTCKFLGIIINSSLTWIDHIYLIKQKVSKTIGILKYVKNKLPRQIFFSFTFLLLLLLLLLLLQLLLLLLLVISR